MYSYCPTMYCICIIFKNQSLLCFYPIQVCLFLHTLLIYTLTNWLALSLSLLLISSGGLQVMWEVGKEDREGKKVPIAQNGKCASVFSERS